MCDGATERQNFGNLFEILLSGAGSFHFSSKSRDAEIAIISLNAMELSSLFTA